MRVDVFSTYKDVTERDIRERTVVVLDVLRATTVMVEACRNGARKVIPVVEVDEAIAVVKTLDRRDAVIAGERECLPLPGFDLGNSPLEFTPAAVNGKTVVMTTTNGTSALQAVRNAERILIGSVINRTAVARALADCELDATIVCAGTQGRFSADDIYGAGAVISAMRSLGCELQLNDLGIVSEFLYESDKKSGQRILLSTHHLNRLVGLGLADDIRYCFTEDVTDIVPVCSGGIIVGG